MFGQSLKIKVCYLCNNNNKHTIYMLWTLIPTSWLVGEYRRHKLCLRSSKSYFST